MAAAERSTSLRPSTTLQSASEVTYLILEMQFMLCVFYDSGDLSEGSAVLEFLPLGYEGKDGRPIQYEELLPHPGLLFYHKFCPWERTVTTNSAWWVALVGPTIHSA